MTDLDQLAAPCTCDRDDDTHEDEPIVLCPKHEAMLRPLRWDTLASMVVDLLEYRPTAYIEADPDEQGIIIDALAGHRDASERRAMVNGSAASAERAEICARLIRRIVGAK